MLSDSIRVKLTSDCPDLFFQRFCKGLLHRHILQCHPYPARIAETVMERTIMPRFIRRRYISMSLIGTLIMM